MIPILFILPFDTTNLPYLILLLPIERNREKRKGKKEGRKGGRKNKEEKMEKKKKTKEMSAQASEKTIYLSKIWVSR